MNIELSSRIKELREHKRCTQNQLAKAIGVGQTTVANYEKGTRTPDAEKLNKIADFFRVTIDYLLGREQENLLYNEERKINISMVTLNNVYKILLEYLIKGRRELAREIVKEFYEQGYSVKDIYFTLIERVLVEVGTLWEKGHIDVWQEHFISEALLDIMRELKAMEDELPGKGYSILAFTSGPEMHNIGLRMITDLLQLEGYNIIYLGSNLPVASIINAIEMEKPHIVAISTTLPYHIDSAKNTITAIKNHFVKNAPKIIIGGAAYLNCENPCEETGADYYGENLEDVISYGIKLGRT